MEVRCSASTEIDELPPYAILSHTWNLDEKAEVIYEDLINGTGKDKASYGKILFCQRQAAADSLCHFWIDTCCINRQSSAELSEAINSMFRWYRDSSKCYVLLMDVHSSDWETSFKKSRWFTRGWTLQELLAPGEVEFFSADHVRIGDKKTLEAGIMASAGIPQIALHGHPLRQFSVTERMAWAKDRATTRGEDRVYCLLGIFGVSMSVIYGEGIDRALERLCEEISRHGSTGSSYGSWNDSIFTASITEDLSVLRNVLQRIEATLIIHAGVQQTTIAMHPAVTDRSVSSRSNVVMEHPVLPSRMSRTDIAPLNPNTAEREGITKQSSPVQWALRKAMQVLSLLGKPSWYFETQSSWRGEKYAPQDLGPQYVCYSVRLTLKGARIAMASQDIWVLRNGTQWLCIKLILSISVESPDWHLIADQEEQRITHVGARPMPPEMHSLVTETLADHADINEDSRLHIQCGAADSLAPSYKLTEVIQTIDMDMSAERKRLKRFTDTLRHRDIPRYSEECMATRYLAGVRFLAFLEGQCFAYYILPTDHVHYTLWWKRLEMAIAFRNAPHFSTFKGLVMDATFKKLRGILVEIPAKGPMFVIMEAHRRRHRPIPWPIRQRWAKQIVTAVAMVHEQGLILGQLRTYSKLFCIDEHDNAILTLGDTGDHPNVHAYAGLIPPEVRSRVYGRDWDDVTPEYDIFMLGLYLWHLYRDEDHGRPKHFCAAASCYGAEEDICELHKDPVALPQASVDVPEWLTYIISMCRRADPASRPRARDLLRYFPSDDEIARTIDKLSDDQKMIYGTLNPNDACDGNKRLEAFRQTYLNFPLCEYCRTRCFGESFHCEVCHDGNFDCCPACFAAGKHCERDEHLLLKVAPDVQSGTVLKGYSSVKKNGQREETTF